MACLLLAWLLLQGIAVPAAESGSVTGVLRNPDGTPAAAVRVAAQAQDDTTDALAGTTLVSLTETDSRGRFVLDNIPPGRYQIMAGLLELPTYFPGTPDRTQSRTLRVAPGDRLEGIDFVLATALRIVTSSWVIPVDVRVVGAARFPVFAGGVFPRLVLQPVQGGPWTEASLLASGIAPLGSPAEYRAGVEDLPAGFTVAGLTFGPTDLRTGTLRLSRSELPESNSILYRNGTVDDSRSAQTSTGIVITLAADSPSSRSRPARVAGRLPTPMEASVWISGREGILYSDGTFEFEGVLPGNHLITAFDRSSRTLAASVVIGSSDVDGLRLSPVMVLPPDFMTVRSAGNSGRPPGTVVPPVTVRGVVRTKSTGQPITSGVLTLKGSSGLVLAVDREGRFEIPNLFPGRYELTLSVFDHFTLTTSILVATEDLDLDLSLRRVY